MSNLSTSNVKDVDNTDINHSTAQILSLFFYTGSAQTIAIFGVLTNIMNIMCFVKQGFNEVINISLLGLTISDLCSLLTLSWTSISMTLIFCSADVPFDVLGVAYLVSGRPHFTFTRITCWITALITLERCLCIIIPLKVKNIITPNRVWGIIVSTYIILLFSEAPIYVVNTLGQVFFPGRNRTLLGLVFAHDREQVEKISISFNNFFIQSVACIVLVISTILLLVSLSERSKWRKASTTGTDINTRNQRVAKMVLMISILFISCFIPVTIVMLATALLQELKVGGKYINTSIVVFGFGLTMESINSSANIFIYYNMSSKYRDSFRLLFCKYKHIDS